MKLKQEKGITLVALIITIIVLLILAMVSIRLVMNGGIIDRAERGTKAYTEAEIAEQLKLVYAEYQMGQYQTPVDIQSRLQEIFGNNNVQDVSVANGKINAKIKVNGEFKTYKFDAGTGTIKKMVQVTAAQIAADPEKYYGQVVSNYTAGGNIYRIFYVDTEGKFGDRNTIYLKTNGNAMSLYSKSSYTPIRTDVLKLMNPDWWASRAESSWNANEKCASFLCDPTTSEVSSNQEWARYFDKESANYVIGSPSVEMYVASYNQVTHTVGNYSLGASYRATSTPGYIHTLNGTQSTVSNNDYTTGQDTLDYVGYNGMYCIRGSVWLSSPSSVDGVGGLCSVAGTGLGYTYLYYGPYIATSCSCEPVVSLKSSFIPEVEE